VYEPRVGSGRQTSIRESKHLISNLELPLLCFGTEFLYDTAELDTEDQADVGGEWVFALSLEKVHAVQPEGLDAHEGLGGLGRRFGDRRIEEEGGGGTFAIFNVWRRG
jgi:hypothetical protein